MDSHTLIGLFRQPTCQVQAIFGAPRRFLGVGLNKDGGGPIHLHYERIFFGFDFRARPVML
jgi:hypothetical protein